MAKILRKFTTIPSHLYVDRNADSQLINIIEEMDRPGYILVARQMGKTNLLINAKRKLQSENNVYAYIDLSNVFANEKDCYRNIIDMVIASNEDLFSEISPIIEKERSEQELPPHKEHLKELRKLLKAVDDKIVIILDEIDALRTAEYSDKIFAQIRSTYFARTTFPELEKLTYILSGVIEPSDLIKDRNKSPFNIGEKIYLDDFSFSEHCTFIEKSQLNISESISKEIYNWTNGNPRLTFDICSEIEDLNGNGITKEDLETLIKNKYLKTYDVAPIDHIRELVKGNKTIRKAIREINNGNTELSDSLKKKLYLYGIISSDFDSTKINIKNKVIQLALSNDWLNSLDKDNADLFTLGQEKINEGEFKVAISYLEEYVSNAENITSRNKNLSLYKIGFAYYKLSDFPNALEAFKKTEFKTDKDFQFYYYSNAAYIGVTYFALYKYADGAQYLEKVIDEYQQGYPYRHALLNLSSYYSKIDVDKALELYIKLKKHLYIDVDDLTESEILRLKASVRYNICDLLNRKGLVKEAKQELEKAKKYDIKTFTPTLLLKEFILDGSSNIEILKTIVEQIISNEITFEDSIYSAKFSENTLFSILLQLFFFKEMDLFDKLIDYSTETLFKKTRTKFELLLIISSISSNKKISIEICELIISEEGLINDDKILLFTYRSLSLLTFNNGNHLKYFSNYLKLFKDLSFEIKHEDLNAFAYAIKKNSDLGRISDALSFCNIISARFDNIDDDLRFEGLIIYYWYSHLYFRLKDRTSAIKYAEMTLEIITRSKKKNNSSIDEKGLNEIKDQMIRIKKASISGIPIIRKERKYGRNEIVKVRYLDGNQVSGKYKKYEADIIAERCKIID